MKNAMILFLQYFFKGKYVVENVQGYYKPLIEPQKIGRHYYWANFTIPDKNIDYVQIGIMNRQASKEVQRRAIIREAQISSGKQDGKTYLIDAGENYGAIP